MGAFKRKIKKFIPPIIIELLNSFYLKNSLSKWTGDYDSWENALSNSTSYDNFEIIEKCKNALLKVKNGEAAYERDSVLFDSIQYSWPLLSSLMLVSLINERKLSVIDFGGSFGSTYYQNRKYLNYLKDLKYNIVEQERFVVQGKIYFENEILKFYNSIGECIDTSGKPNMLILSSTLQYFKDPKNEIRKIIDFKIPFILVDLTPFNLEKKERLMVQKVSTNIYNASYPCWLLNYDEIMNLFSSSYEIFSEHENSSSIIIDNNTYNYRGFLLKYKF